MADPARNPRSRPVQVALCLSGGGYRAAIYHLGALWRLHETGVLPTVERISSVSGGSIVAGFLAARVAAEGAGADQAAFARWCAGLDFRTGLAEPFRRVTGTDIRTWPVLKSFVPNLFLHRFGSGAVAKAYGKLITDAPLSALPVAPNFVFCTTDLTFGVNWEFSRQRVGDYQAGYLAGEPGGRQPGDYGIALAIACSSCFPPIFGPHRLDTTGLRFVHGSYRGADRAELLGKIDLSDGGVYDNLGTEPVIKHARVVLVSDGGAPFAFRAGGPPLRRLARYAAVIGNQAVALRKRMFHELRTNQRFAGAMWAIGRDESRGALGYERRLVEDVLANVRTDLDRFLDAEFEILVNHGYAGCAAAIAHPKARVEVPNPVPARWPFPGRTDADGVRKALRNSHQRLAWERLFGD